MIAAAVTRDKMLAQAVLAVLLLLATAEPVVNTPPDMNNHSAAMIYPSPQGSEPKYMEPWVMNQQQIQQQQQYHHQPSAVPSYVSLPNSVPTLPPYVPDNYAPPAHHYGPPPTTEFRSEHYAYPFEPYPYPVAPPPIDASLIPTGKHFIIVSFIGLLLLFAIIQNSIAAAKRKDALVEVLSNRRKRELIATPNFEPMTPEAESALEGDARVSCIQRTLCYENRKLLEDLGTFGKVFAKYLTYSVQSSLKELSPGWDRLVEDAARTGLRGEDCNLVYRDCSLKLKIQNVSGSKEADEKDVEGEENKESEDGKE